MGPLDSQVVAEQLERHDVDDGLDVLGDTRDREQDGVGATDARNLLVILAANDDKVGATGAQLLDDGDHLAVERVGGGDDDDGHVLIDQGQGPVLHLSGKDALAVHQGDFLDLEGALDGGGVVWPAAEDEQRVLVLQLFGELGDGCIESERLFHGQGYGAEAFEDGSAVLLGRDAVPAEGQGQQEEDDNLRRVRLGRGDSDLRTGVDVHATVRASGDRGPDGVGDADTERAALEGELQAAEGVRRLAAL